MKIKKIILVGLTMLLLSAVGYFILYLGTSMHTYMDKSSKRDDYTKITTPLPRNVINDICSKFEINNSDPRCSSNSVVYGPDFFSDIKSFLGRVDAQHANWVTVQEKLGKYLVVCGEPDNQGRFSCRYDLRGDDFYPIGIFFTKDKQYYRVIANTGGS